MKKVLNFLGYIGFIIVLSIVYAIDWLFKPYYRWRDRRRLERHLRLLSKEFPTVFPPDKKGY